jgi:hypothetical protein
MTRFLRFVCPILSVGLLSGGYFLGGLDWPAVGLLVFGVLWIVGLALRWDWVSPLGMFAAFGAAAIGLVLDLSPVFLSSAALCALLAWDLAEFSIRLRLASSEDDVATLEKRHLLRLGAVVLAGGVLNAIALTLRLKPSFEWIVILMFFAVWGIGRMVDWLLKKQS